MARYASATIFSGGPAVATPTAQLVVQLLLILVMCSMVERIGRPLRQPAVVAEKVAGILLGPSVLGLIPEFSNSIFPVSSYPALKAVADLGLILFLFLAGATHDLPSLRLHARRSIILSLAGIIGAASLGGGAALGIYRQLEAPLPDVRVFLLFACTALAATAMSVLARVLAEARLLGTVVGAAALHASAVDDSLVIAVLCVDVAVSRANGYADAGWALLCTAAFAAALAFIAHPLAARAASRWIARSKLTTNAAVGGTIPHIPHAVLAIVLGSAFFSAWFTEMIGAHAAVGAFLAGLATPRVGGIAGAAAIRVELLTTQLLMPV